MFDLRRFDEPEIVEPEEIIPTFTEEELAAARAEAMEQGRAEGHRQANQANAASREQLTANALRTISESFTTIFAAEYDREKKYEQESVQLTLGVLEKLFPVLNASFGQDEIRAIIMKVLKSRAKKSLVTIEVCPDDAPSIEETLAAYWTDPETAPRYRVLSNPSFRAGQCKMGWEDGGAVRNAEELAENIRLTLTALLGIEGAKAAESVPDLQNNAIKEEDSGESSLSAAAETQIQPGEEP